MDPDDEDKSEGVLTGDKSDLPMIIDDGGVVEGTDDDINDDDDGTGGGEFESLWSLLPVPPLPLLGWDKGPILFLKIREIDETEGTLNLSQTLSNKSFSRISQANIPGSLTL